MTEFHVEVVRLGKIGKHPNADNLSITHVFGGYPCITRTGDFKEGDLAVYVPVDTTLPDIPQFDFLSQRERKRLRAKKLRGLFSMGLLIRPPAGATEGEDVAERLGITKWEPPVELSTGGECESDPVGWYFLKYTSIEGLRKYPEILDDGEQVAITEKIHGANGRFVYDGERLWVGSHKQVKREDSGSIWWKAAASWDLANRLKRYPGLIFYGEVYGKVQDLKYGVPAAKGVDLRFFDAYSVREDKYLNYEDAKYVVEKCGLIWVPEIYVGPWKGLEWAKQFAEGHSYVVGANHIREGFVVKPVTERWHPSIGRVILKLHGEGYLLRKQK